MKPRGSLISAIRLTEIVASQKVSMLERTSINAVSAAICSGIIELQIDELPVLFHPQRHRKVVGITPAVGHLRRII